MGLAEVEWHHRGGAVALGLPAAAGAEQGGGIEESGKRLQPKRTGTKKTEGIVRKGQKVKLAREGEKTERRIVMLWR